MDRREYPIQLSINGRKITKVIIDPHFEIRHQNSINDDIIIALVRQLNERVFTPVKADKEFEYFVEDHMKLDNKLYKLVWLLQEDEVYVGVINCYRRD